MALSSWPPFDGLMKARLKRVSLGLLSYLMFLLPLVYAVQKGWTDMTLVGVLGCVIYALLANGVFFVLIRSGKSASLPDPSLTLAQIITSIVLGLIVMRYAGEVRAVFSMIFVVAFFFGVFGLSRKEFLGLTAGTLIGYVALVGSKIMLDNTPSDQFQKEILIFMALAIMLSWATLLGGYVAQMRDQRQEQKKKMQDALDKLERIASHDELTGIYNRRHMLSILEHEKASFDRLGHDFCVALLDIDFFKKINDSYGHAVGDEVLKLFSEALFTHTRRMDWLGVPDRDFAEASFGRYGGEEFILLMPHTAQASAKMGLDRLRARIMDVPLNTSIGEVPITFSAGIAQYRKGERIKDTLSRADQALYQAKANGRNRTEVF